MNLMEFRRRKHLLLQNYLKLEAQNNEIEKSVFPAAQYLKSPSSIGVFAKHIIEDSLEKRDLNKEQEYSIDKIQKSAMNFHNMLEGAIAP